MGDEQWRGQCLLSPGHHQSGGCHSSQLQEVLAERPIEQGIRAEEETDVSELEGVVHLRRHKGQMLPKPRHCTQEGRGGEGGAIERGTSNQEGGERME